MSLGARSDARAAPFSHAVVRAMRKLYPESLADHSFDNTGLLLEAPFDPLRRQMNSVLLTIDLTQAVADEAIERNDCCVVAYHPIIFRGLKALTLADTQQQSLLRLAAEGISVYSPHTAVDAAPGGLSDWLADIVTGKLPDPEPVTHSAEEEDGPISKAASARREGVDSNTSSVETSRPALPPRPSLLRGQSYSEPIYPSLAPSDDDDDDELDAAELPHTRTVIQQTPNPPAAFAADQTGIGRLVTFNEAQPLAHLIERIARGVGTPKGFPVAIPQQTAVEQLSIRRVAVCAGSGGSIFRLPEAAEADLLFTGELAHHEALAATERGQCVITLFHSNSERGYLRAVLRDRLLRTLRSEWAQVCSEEKERLQQLQQDKPSTRQDAASDAHSGWHEALADETVEVAVSEADRDPYGIVILQDSAQQGTNLD